MKNKKEIEFISVDVKKGVVRVKREECGAYKDLHTIRF